MAPRPSGDETLAALVNASRQGDESAFRELVAATYAIAARAMRQLVCDEVKARATLKRGSGEQPLSLRTSIHLVADEDEEALRLHDALERLEAVEPRLARLVELRVFAGQTEREAAACLDTSLRTVQRDWRRARAWLAVALGNDS